LAGVAEYTSLKRATFSVLKKEDTGYTETLQRLHGVTS